MSRWILLFSCTPCEQQIPREKPMGELLKNLADFYQSASGIEEML
jgi:hypothetical protein